MGGGAAYVSCGVTISRPSLLFDIIPYFVQQSSLRSSSLALPLYFISISLLPTSVLVSSHHILYYSITLYFKAAGSGAASTAIAVPFFSKQNKLQNLTQKHHRNTLLHNMMTSFSMNLFGHSSGIRASSMCNNCS